MMAMSSSLKGVLRAFVLLLALFAAVALAETGHAQTRHARSTNIAASLVVEGPARPGGSVMLAIHMRPGAGWHGYWLNPGDAGLGMQLDWTLPQGFTAGEPQYPVPQTLLISGLMNHVYKGDYAVLVPLAVPASAKPGSTVPLVLDAQWLACTDEVCVPESGRLSASLRIGEPSQPDARFERWRGRLPAPLDATARFALAGDALRLAIPLPASAPLDAPHLFLASDRIADYAAPQRFSRTGDMLVIELRRPSAAPASPERIEGVLRMGASGPGVSFAATPGKVPPVGVPLQASDAAPPLTALPLLLASALLGGLLLNVMPCVFPILSLKAVSLARAGESKAQARAEGLAYTAGVIAACLALGALLLGLRAGGEQIGWAFQLQEPGIVALLLLLAVALTTNFLGLFEIMLPGLSGDGSARGAFATGLLAAFVATPCTGPFMAAAMGAALLLPTLPALLLFAALGLGLALPFLALAFVPALRRRLPRPGPWMTRFRRWMALPMGLTALALAWLAWRVGGNLFALACIALAAALVLALWFAGRRQRRGHAAGIVIASGLVLIVVAGFAVLPSLTAASDARQAEAGITGAVPFSEARLAQARAAGKPVFVWMTADWCITCKVNEQAAIEREATAAAFRRAGVVVLRGDWTLRDPGITRFLTANGAAGVPFYLWVPAGGGAPERLPQVLTVAMLVDRAAAAD
jgi:DsbC/DsbD-like thiol-disulfide interchange protein/cytochrome c biogenesis protein CcdA